MAQSGRTEDNEHKNAWAHTAIDYIRTVVRTMFLSSRIRIRIRIFTRPEKMELLL